MPTSAGEAGAAGTAGEGCVAVGGKELCAVTEGKYGGANSGSQDCVVPSAGVGELGDATDGKVPVVKSAVGGAGASSAVGSASGGDIRKGTQTRA